MKYIPLYLIPDGAIIMYQGKKHRVTADVRRFVDTLNQISEYRYIYPYLPYAKENQSNLGFTIPQHYCFQVLKK